MKRSRTIKLFLKDHIWYLVTCVTAFGLLGALFAYLDKNSNFLYFGLLCLFVCIIGLGYRFVRCKGLYEKIAAEKHTVEDYIPDKEGGLLVRQYERTLMECRSLLLDEIDREKDKNKQHQMMINRWVHQMKTPLAVIKMIGDKHPYDEDFETVAKEVRRQNYYLDQMLGTFRLDYMGQDLVVEKCSLYEIVREAVNSQKSYFLEKSIFPKVDIGGETDVYTDRKWCAFALEQIINNAIKYTPPEGRVFITADTEDGTECLTIRDEGCGIAASDMGRVFELFYTGNNGRDQKEATGMGLYMVKTILDYLNTSISVESEEGKGTIFTIGFGGQIT